MSEPRAHSGPAIRSWPPWQARRAPRRAPRGGRVGISGEGLHNGLDHAERCRLPQRIDANTPLGSLNARPNPGHFGEDVRRGTSRGQIQRRPACVLQLCRRARPAALRTRASRPAVRGRNHLPGPVGCRGGCGKVEMGVGAGRVDLPAMVSRSPPSRWSAHAAVRRASRRTSLLRRL
jgi:hypothetical protein